MEENLFKDEKPSILTVEFPLHIRNKKGTIYWRYHIDGKYEMISFDKHEGASFNFSVNEYHKDYSKNEFDNNFILQQVILFERIEEDEFIAKMEEFFNKHQIFLGLKKKENEPQKNNRLEDQIQTGEEPAF